MPKNNTIFELFREALGNSHHDFTRGDLRRAIVILAIPMILEMIMESLFGVVDMFFVAKLGVDSLATVALTESILVLLFGVAIGLSMATTAFVARRIGEKDPTGAADAAVQSIVVGIAVSLCVAAIAIPFAPQLLRLMGGTPTVVATGTEYTRILLGGSIVIFLLFLINAVFRGAGDAALAMRVLWIANGINIVLDPCLINGWLFFPKLGVAGAAVATTTGRGIGVAFQIYFLLSGSSRVKVAVSQIRILPGLLWRLLKVSGNGILQFLISTASWTVLIRVTATFGSVPVAAYTVAIKIFLFLLLPAWGLSAAAATLVGQCLGAKKPERAEAAVYQTGRYNMAYMAVVTFIFLVFAPQLSAFFTRDEAVQKVAIAALRFIGSGNMVYAWGMVLVQALNGSGDTRTPSIINFVCYWCFQIPLAITLSKYTSWGTSGVFVAIPAAELAMALCSLYVFRLGAWKRKEI